MKYEKQTKMILTQLGVNRSYLGYNYVVYGVSLVIKDETCLNYITKSLYIDIASKYHTTWRCVERNIRTVVEIVWSTENLKMLKMVCGGTIGSKPSNKEFLLLLADYIILAEELRVPISNKDMFSRSIEQYICPRDGMECRRLKILYERLLEMERNYGKLQEQ